MKGCGSRPGNFYSQISQHPSETSACLASERPKQRYRWDPTLPLVAPAIMSDGQAVQEKLHTLSSVLKLTQPIANTQHYSQGNGHLGILEKLHGYTAQLSPSSSYRSEFQQMNSSSA